MRVVARDDEIGIVRVLQQVTALGDWSQISGMDDIRGRTNEYIMTEPWIG